MTRAECGPRAGAVRLLAIGGLAGVLLASLPACAEAPDALTVFAAASLADVVEAAAPPSARVTVGATSLLGQQIARGAPADVFLAADPRWIACVDSAGRTVGAPVDLARGRLVVVARAPASPARTARAALRDAERIALADPSHVPAGRYAEAALRRVEAWDAVADRIVPAADVRAALVAVQRGAADAGVVYASDALAAPFLEVVYRFGPSETPEILYQGVATSGDAAAQAWLEALRDHEAWSRLGFEPL